MKRKKLAAITVPIPTAGGLKFYDAYRIQSIILKERRKEVRSRWLDIFEFSPDRIFCTIAGHGLR